MSQFFVSARDAVRRITSYSRGKVSLRRAFVVAAVMSAFAAVSPQARDLGETESYEALAGLRYGLSVTDLEGNVVAAHRADERFAPASNVKLFVTAAALAAQDALSSLDYGLRVVTEPAPSGPPTLALLGRGDPTVGFGANCHVRCVETLAAAVAAAGISEVGDIVGDDQWFADERRPLGWSWDDLKFGHGTSVSAIAVNDNVLPLRVTPAGAAGSVVRVAWLDPDASYFDLSNEATTSEAQAPRALRLERRIGERAARLYGALPVGSRSMKLDLGVDDPAHLATWYFKRALEAEGVAVTGELRTRRRPLQYADEPKAPALSDPAARRACAKDDKIASPNTLIAALEPAPIKEIVTTTNQKSQNLYAEVLLRQLGRAAGTGSSFCGLLQIQDFMTEIGVRRESFDVADGSGLSNYNRATPAAITALLRHAAAAPWGEDFRASLPVAGAPTGSLRYRFRGTPLDGKVFAKTGTLNHVDALSGYMQAKSGKQLAFSIIVNDRPLESPSAMGRIEQTLLEIAAQN